MPKEIHLIAVFFKSTVNFLCIVYLPSPWHPLDSRFENNVKKSKFKHANSFIYFDASPFAQN